MFVRRNRKKRADGTERTEIMLAHNIRVEGADGESVPKPVIFARLGKTMEEAGGKLGDMVTMTVFITDARYGDRFTQLRRDIFGDNFPASALITVTGLARPELLVEVQGIAVIG